MKNHKTITTLSLFLLFFCFVSYTSATMTISNPLPSDNKLNVDPNSMILSVTVNDSSRSICNITFYSNLSGVWDYFYLGDVGVTYANVSCNGTYGFNPVFFVNYTCSYWWNVSVDNGTDGNVEGGVYKFITVSGLQSYGGGGVSDDGSMSIGVSALGLSVVGVLAFIRRRRR